MATKRTRRPKTGDPDWMKNAELTSCDLARERETNLKYVINSHYSSVLDSLWRALPNTSEADFAKIIRGILAEGNVTDCTLHEEWADRISENNSDRKLNLYKLSCLYCLLAEKARVDNENGWSLIAEARTHWVLYCAIEDAESEQKYAAEYRKNKSAGGQKVSKIRFKAAKEEAIKLLKEKYPPDGWDVEDTAPAVEEILPGMSDFILKNSIDLSWDDLPRTLRRWIKTAPDVSAAYSTLCAKTPSKPKPKKKSQR